MRHCTSSSTLTCRHEAWWSEAAKAGLAFAYCLTQQGRD
jgi:hypothetical protein